MGLTDECDDLVSGADSRNFTATRSGSSPEQCPLAGNANDEGSGYYNCTLSGSRTRAMSDGWWNLTFNADKEFYTNITVTKVDAFVMTRAPELSNAYVSPTVGGWGRIYKFNVSLHS